MLHRAADSHCTPCKQMTGNNRPVHQHKQRLCNHGRYQPPHAHQNRPPLDAHDRHLTSKLLREVTIEVMAPTESACVPNVNDGAALQLHDAYLHDGVQHLLEHATHALYTASEVRIASLVVPSSESEDINQRLPIAPRPRFLRLCKQWEDDMALWC